MGDPRSPGGWLAAGRVGRPHGLDGSFHVEAARGNLLEEGAEVTVGEARVAIARRAGTDARPIVRLEGVEDRDAAQSLRGTELLVPMHSASRPDAGGWWAEELEGCEVVDGGRPVGVVRRLLALPSCEALEVERAAGAAVLVPLVADAVRDVDVQRRRIDIDLRFLGTQD